MAKELSNEQILKKAIDKAIQNEYKTYWTDSLVNVFYDEPNKDGDRNILL